MKTRKKPVRSFRVAVVFAALICFFGPAFNGSAQVRVSISLKRLLYVQYEPILATVRIQNLSGGELELADDGPRKWFGFQIAAADGRSIPPVNPDYSLNPIRMGPGQVVERTVNLTPLFLLSEYGSYRVKAVVFVRQLNRYFSSADDIVEVTEGKAIWRQHIGVPPDSGLEGTRRLITVMTHAQGESTSLYVRIEDTDNGVIYCTHRLGKITTFGQPEIVLDLSNHLHVLQATAPGAYAYTELSLDGKVLKREFFAELSSRPTLKKGMDGLVAVAGGTLYDPNAPPVEAAAPKVSDRPVPLPQSKIPPKPAASPR